MVKFKLIKDKLSNLIKPLIFSLPLLIASLSTIVIGSVRQLGYLQSLELAEFDLMMRLRSETELDSRITIIGIEESDIQTWQQSTFNDRLLANLIKEIQQYHPAVIGLDVYRDIPQQPGNRELLEQLAAENLIVIKKLGKKGVPAPPNVPDNRVGFNNFILDPDGKVRRNYMLLEIGKQTLPSFALQISKSYLNAEPLWSAQSQVLSINQTVFPSLKADMGGYQLSNSKVGGSQILLNYRSSNKAVRRLTFTQVIKGDFNPDWITNKIIIIGYTAFSKKDIFSTPLAVEKIPGVVVHAHMVSQILSTVLDGKPLWRSLPQSSEYLWIWLWSISSAIIVWRSKHPLNIGFGLVLSIGGVLVVCLVSFSGLFWIPATPAIISLLGTTGITLAYKNFYSSIIDELTGLANRKQIINLLQQSITAKKPTIAVLSINITRFKTIANSLGKGISDRLLILISNRIQNCVRTQDSLGRVNLAEFMLILADLDDQDHAVAIAQRIQQELASPFNIKKQRIVISTDVGIAFYQLGEDRTAEDLLRNSNLAQERAQVLGKNQYAVFTPRMYSETIAQWQLENDLRRAIELQEFELYYQPIIDLKSDRVAGFEALVRWNSPHRGFVSPGEFIPLAESSGLIIPLGDWILQAACRQMYQWHQQFNSPKLTISVNLSSQQFRANLIARISQILAQTQLPPQYLKLEITESAMMDNVKAAIALLQQLKALGIKLSIDDFGTGYSSLSYLQQFCADTLKVDRSFVSQMECSDKNQAIVDIIITLAHKLGMDVIAEGIETQTHQLILKSLNCEYGQGYFFAKPLKDKAATALLTQQFGQSNLAGQDLLISDNSE